jgi:hypothetical protein
MVEYKSVHVKFQFRIVLSVNRYELSFGSFFLALTVTPQVFIFRSTTSTDLST